MNYKQHPSSLDLATLLERRHRKVNNFPKEGIQFIDLLGMLSQDGAILRIITESLTNRYRKLESDKNIKIDGISAIDSRGFIFASPLAYKLEKPIIALRKKGKLPPPVESLPYNCEYASTDLEASLHSLQGKRKVIIVDDILATGGTASAAISLLRKFEVDVEEVCFIVDIAKLDGKARLKEEHPDVKVYTCASL